MEIEFSRKRGGGAGAVGRSFGAIFGLIFTAAGTLFLVVIGREALQSIETYFWEPVQADIQSSRIAEDAGSDNPYSIEVSYTYRYRGKSRRSTKHTLGSSSFNSYKDARRELDRMQPGSRVTAYVDPENPAEAVLLRGSLGIIPLLLLPLIFIGIGAAIIFAAVTKKAAGGSGPTKAISESAKRADGGLSWKGRLIGMGFCSIFLIVGCVAFYFITIRPIGLAQAAKSWRPATATVQSSRVKSQTSDDGTTYSVDILYAYEVNGEEYKSDRYSFVNISTSSYSSKREIVDQHPPGKRITVYVDPEDPLEAVIDRSIGGEVFFGLFTLIFVFFGAGGMVLVWVAGTSGKTSSAGFSIDLSASRQARAAAAETSPGMSTGKASISPGGEVVLKPGFSPVGKLIGITLAALFWNGIIAIPISQAIESWAGNSPEWGLTLIMIPFGLIGLALIFGIGYCLLGLFNPRPTLYLSSDDTGLGDELSLRWELSGKVKRISELSLTIEAIEEAKYRRGTSTYTDTETFYKETFARKSFHQEMRSGSATVPIPANSMHTFAADNNKIKWQLQIRGDIPRWPDVSEKFEITIKPRRSTPQ